MQYASIQPGDHLCYSCYTHYHHGIYCGDIFYKNRYYKQVVIHFEGKHRRGQIRGLAYKKFAQDRKIYILRYKEEACLAPEAVVRRAVDKLGEPNYNLFGNNCEHFAHWCKTGKSASHQVNNAIGILGNLGGSLLGGLAAGTFLPLAVPGVIGIGVAIAAGYICGHLGKLAIELSMGSSDYKEKE